MMARRWCRSTLPKSAILRSPAHPSLRPVTQTVTALKDHIATLQADLREMKAIAGGHRADFERECDRTNKLLAELLQASTETTMAREKAANLEGVLSTVRSPWWRRLPLGGIGRWPGEALKIVMRHANKEDRAAA
jgi:hypothetical protein